MSLELLAQPRLVIAPGLQIVLQHTAIVDDDQRQTAFGGLDVHIRRDGGLLVGIRKDRDLTVGLQYGVFHCRDVGNAFHSQLFHQFIHGEAVFSHLTLVEFAVFYNNGRPPTEQRPKFYAFHGKH